MSFFYEFGKMLGPKVRKAKWVMSSLTGTEADIIRAEAEVGRDLAAAFKQQMPLDARPEVRLWIDDIGNRLAGLLEQKAWRFQFLPVNLGECNAFAVPGGYIFITRGLLDLCQWDADETAFVLGHEMGHVVSHHAMDRLMANSLLNAAMMRLPLGRGVLKPSLASLAGTLLQQGYSREQEFEADRFGCLLSRRAGFAHDAGVRLLNRLQSEAGDTGVLASYFTSHPPFPSRIQHLNGVGS
ncbi:MAG: M48 family metalloprotease [Gemmataceae bacterium]